MSPRPRRQAAESERQTIVANDALVATSRPWVFGTGSVKTDSFIVLPNGDPVITIYVDVTTIGQTPALQVSASGKLITESSSVDILQQQKAVCDAARDAYSRLLKPGQLFIQQTFFPGQGMQRVSVFASNGGNDFTRLYKTDQTVFTPAAIGCINYIDTSGSIHQTGFIYNIYKRSADNSGFEAIDTSRGMLQPSDLGLTNNELGNGPAD